MTSHVKKVEAGQPIDRPAVADGRIAAGQPTGGHRPGVKPAGPAAAELSSILIGPAVQTSRGDDAAAMCIRRLCDAPASAAATLREQIHRIKWVADPT